ncbi:MAG: Gfo/Idh/MocA family oxidoreductase [Gemmataceae bacterium]
MANPQNGNRRDFLKTSAGTALTAGILAAGGAHAAGSDEIKVGVIGCGGRGSGAAEDVLNAAPGVTIHALGDAFPDRAEGLKRRLENVGKTEEIKAKGNKVDIGSRVFVGLDAYKQVIDSGVNYVILATPPGFRPLHIEAAVSAGKNLFTEKPVGVDGPGIRKVLAAYEDARKKKLGVAAGTQRRHQGGYIETIKRIHQGEIGQVLGGACYWMQGILWRVPRQKEWTDLQWQMRNWYNFTWLCGDHIVEQHVHNIDVINWVLQAHPTQAIGMGFRTRTDPDYGHIYDFFAIDYVYPGGVHINSMCRQINNCVNSVSEYVVGSKGNSQVNEYRINGKSVYRGKRGEVSPYVQEHTDLITSIRKGDPINELRNVAESTLTAIMGRMSAYTGKRITWEEALNSKEELMPEKLSFDMNLPVPPVAVPGKTLFS